MTFSPKQNRQPRIEGRIEDSLVLYLYQATSQNLLCGCLTWGGQFEWTIMLVGVTSQFYKRHKDST